MTGEMPRQNGDHIHGRKTRTFVTDALASGVFALDDAPVVVEPNPNPPQSNETHLNDLAQARDRVGQYTGPHTPGEHLRGDISRSMRAGAQRIIDRLQRGEA